LAGALKKKRRSTENNQKLRTPQQAVKERAPHGEIPKQRTKELARLGGGKRRKNAVPEPLYKKRMPNTRNKFRDDPNNWGEGQFA